MNALEEQLLKQGFRQVTFVAEEFAKEFIDKPFHLQWGPIIGITGGKHKVHDMAGVAGNQMEFKPIKPADRAMPTLGQSLEDLVGMDSPVVADPQGRGINKTDAAARTSGPGF